jgi:hypothetical protein
VKDLLLGFLQIFTLWLDLLPKMLVSETRMEIQGFGFL